MHINILNLSKINFSLDNLFLIAKTNIENNLLVLDWVFCIYYAILFKENKIQAQINLSSKINVITLGYALKLELKICFINIRA